MKSPSVRDSSGPRARAAGFVEMRSEPVLFASGRGECPPHRVEPNPRPAGGSFLCVRWVQAACCCSEGGSDPRCAKLFFGLRSGEPRYTEPQMYGKRKMP